jgi:hypothetical protein
VLRLLIPAVLVLSTLGCVAFVWWERRHPSRFEPADRGPKKKSRLPEGPGE